MIKILETGGEYGILTNILAYRGDGIVDMLKIRDIYERLQDNESRMVFMQRLQYYLDGDDKHLLEMVNTSYNLDFESRPFESEKRKQFQELVLRNGIEPKPIVVYGAGTLLRYILPMAEDADLEIECLCDSNPKLAGTVKRGFDIISPDALIRDYKGAYILISPIGRNADEIYGFLRQSGYDDSQIFFGALELRCQQYFGFEAIKAVPDEIFVDAGCCDGGTVKGFIDFCGGNYKRIYAMEPDPENFLKTMEFINENHYHNIQIVKKGAWNEDTEISFLNNSDGTSTINESGSIKISVTSIDEMVNGDAVTFIKMDIEGAELKALKGAENTIKKHKPKLAICAYHKPEDILTIPGYICDIVPEYKFYLRHHSMTFSETVLYATL